MITRYYKSLIVFYFSVCPSVFPTLLRDDMTCYVALCYSRRLSSTFKPSLSDFFCYWCNLSCTPLPPHVLSFLAHWHSSFSYFLTELSHLISSDSWYINSFKYPLRHILSFSHFHFITYHSTTSSSFFFFFLILILLPLLLLSLIFLVVLPATMDDPRQRRPDITTAKLQLDWEPRVPVRDGLAKAIEYFSKVTFRPTNIPHFYTSY